jgi:capsular exopolysaccharide synthesis family protein
MENTNIAFRDPEKDFQVSMNLPGASTPSQTWIQPELEWYENIKPRLFARYPEESIKSIVFTGIADGSGTTTTAISFAKALVMYNQVKVLLIDANLRAPFLQNVFGIKHNNGLADLLAGKSSKAFKIMKIGLSYLCVLTSGENLLGPVNLFESWRFDEFLKKMRNLFDFIIIDAAPLATFPESRILIEKVDGVILVIRSGKIRRQVALRAKQDLEESGARVLGVVLNRRKYHIPEWLYQRM